MSSIQNTLRCPHCAVELEVNAVISRLSLRWLGGPARPAPTGAREEPVEGAVIEPPPRIEDKGK